MLSDRVIEKGIPSESVIAQLTVDKYVYGMLLHRQIDRYSKMGVRIPVSCASDWLMRGWEQRTEERKKHARPVLERLEKWLKENQYMYRPKSPMGEAIDYTLPRWAGLSAYELHGQMEIGRAANLKNLILNAVRPLSVGRKAFLFAGSHQAAEMAAGIYSFMASCKKNNINEFEWLRDVFERIQSLKQKDLHQLMPSN